MGAVAPSTIRTPIFAWATACTIVVAVAIVLAVRTYGSTVPGVYLTPDLRVSSVGLPTWDGIRQGLHFPERIVAVDGVTLERSDGSYAATAWDDATARAAREGRTSVHVDVETERGARAFDLAFSSLSPLAWWLNSGIPLLLACFYIVAAVVARTANPRGALAGTFARTALASAMMLATFLDFHTTRMLVPIADVSMCMVATSYMMLGLRLPDDAPLVRRRPGFERMVDAFGLGMGLVLVASHRVPNVASVGRQIVTVAFGASQLFFLGVVVTRFRLARGDRRAKLRSLLIAIVCAHAPIGALALIAATTARGSTMLMFLLPMHGLAPLATFVAFVRHDIWASRALLVRQATHAVLVGLVCVVAIGVASAVAAALGVPFREALTASAIGAVIAASLSTFALGYLDRVVFSSRAEYKPTVEQLSEELAAPATGADVAAAVERTVRRWLPCDDVRFILLDDVEDEAPSNMVALGGPGGDVDLRVRFDGHVVGHLRVGPKRGGALFTVDDMDLLRTIANQAALAIAHARAYTELEERRQQQAAAWRDERAAIIETVAAEIAHEVRYPINFFRSIFRRGARALDDEAVEIGTEEVDRLERLVAGLRRVVSNRLERRVVPLAVLAARAEMLLRDTIGHRRLELSIPDAIELRCAPDQATQILVNILSNALDAAGPDGRLGIRWVDRPKGGEIVIWDGGPGFTSEVSTLFTPWFTTKPRGTGLGLAITQRLVRAHEWTIDAARRDGATEFVISVPERDIELSPASSASEVA